MGYEDAKQRFLKDLSEGKQLNWEGKRVVILEALRRDWHPLKLRLRGLGVSQRNAAELVEVSLPTLNTYLNNYTDMPKPIEDTLTKLCQGLEAQREEAQNETD